jgi:glycosyltransferase involved in cell wall biosynthesis
MFSLICSLRDHYDCSLIAPPSDEMIAFARGQNIPMREVNELQARFSGNLSQILRYLMSLGKTLRVVRQVFREERPDVIHANSVRAGLVAQLATLGMAMRIIWHVHDILPRHPFTTAIRLIGLGSRRSLIVGCSKAAADGFRGTLSNCHRDGKTRVCYVHNGIVIPESGPESVDFGAMRASLGVGVDEFVILIVGQIAPRKGQLELIRAFARLPESRAGARLLVVGKPIFNRDDLYLASLEAAVSDLKLVGRVVFLGQRADVPHIMQASNLLVINSKVEPFGLVALEAMLNRTPVLSTRSGGVEEIIEHGVSGHLIPPDNEADLVAALTELQGRPKLLQQYSISGESRVHAEFSQAKFVDRFRHLYNSLTISVLDPLARAALHTRSGTR